MKVTLFGGHKGTVNFSALREKVLNYLNLTV